MKRFLAIVFSMFLSACIGAGKLTSLSNQKDGYFPTLTGIDLMGVDRTIPETFDGKYNLIAVAFERGQQEIINTWITEADKLEASNENFKFYEIPVIYKLNALWRTWINNGMRSGIPDENSRLRTITIYTERDKFLDFMKMNKDTVYLLLLDQNGKIIWQETGNASEEKIKSLQKKIK